MPLNMGLSRAEQKEFNALLFSNHQLLVRFQVMTLSHRYLYDVTDLFIDGQLDEDMEAEVTQTSSLAFFDPGNKMDIDANSPNRGAMFPDRMIKAIYCIGTPDGKKWFTCPAITGVITKVDRDQDRISVELASKEYLLYSSADPDSWKKKKKITDVIKQIFRDYGETKYKVPNLKKKLNKELSVGAEASPMSVLARLFAAIDRIFFYDGRGIGWVKRQTNHTAWTFTENMMTKPPQIGYNLDNLINNVVVIGHKPKGKNTKRLKVKIRAKKKHPLSPHSLGRNGKRRFYTAVIQDESIKSKKEAKKIGRKVLERGLQEAVEVSFETLVVPQLQVGDLVRVKTSDFTATVRYKRGTKGFTSPGTMTFGFQKSVTPAKKKIRKFRK